MFGLSLVDHLRLTFGHVIYSHKAHAQAAERYARWDRWFKAAEVILVLATAVSAVALIYTTNSVHAVSTAITAVAAVVVLVVRLALDFERIASTHRACSGHLWHMREQYRALLADLHDNVLSPESARARRDQLMAALHDIYRRAPPADREEYENARRALGSTDETVLSDEEIDRFLPASLKKAAGQ
jgi:hypothetical protein